MNEKDKMRLSGEGMALDSLLDNLNSIVYVSDIETYEIIYISKNMQEAYGIDEPEGKLCWQVLQNEMSGPCPFCPLTKLLEQEAKTPFYVWEECNTRTGRTYENYDSLIKWTDGRTVHLQHSVDITEFKRMKEMARTDELTGLMNRRAGKQALKNILKKLQGTADSICVSLFDMNGLKQINDLYGHHEGDRSISDIAQSTIENLGPRDFAFRLGGDEFVAVFFGTRMQDAIQRMEAVLTRLGEVTEERASTHENSFCYGILEVSEKDNYTVAEVIEKADKRMYCQKREYHIRKAQEKRDNELCLGQRLIEEFDYDKEHLFDSLMESTDAYIYVGNMKTGTFRYSALMVEEFSLPGQIIPNAAAVWGNFVHPEDKQAFLESNQEIADGRTNTHDVKYRAKNHLGEWVQLRCRGYLIRDKYDIPDLFAGFITNLDCNN